jgi:hypothetical protein
LKRLARLIASKYKISPPSSLNHKTHVNIRLLSTVLTCSKNAASEKATAYCKLTASSAYCFRESYILHSREAHRFLFLTPTTAEQTLRGCCQVTAFRENGFTLERHTDFGLCSCFCTCCSPPQSSLKDFCGLVIASEKATFQRDAHAIVTCCSAAWKRYVAG